MTEYRGTGEAGRMGEEQGACLVQSRKAAPVTGPFSGRAGLQARLVLLIPLLPLALGLLHSHSP